MWIFAGSAALAFFLQEAHFSAVYSGLRIMNGSLFLDEFGVEIRRFSSTSGGSVFGGFISVELVGKIVPVK